MKVLCLHGRGTSGAIFRSQTSSFRSRFADQDIEFDFLDGPYECSAAAGVDLFYDPPYFSWWKGDTVDDVRAAIAQLNEYIAENGPYDAVMMFSQGCVLGSAALLLHQEETPHLPAPFKAAIFICGGPSMPVLEELGFHVSAKARERDVLSRNALTQQAGNSAILAQGAKRWTGLESLNGGLSEDELRSEIECPFRIDIPTVHIYGSKDPRYAAAMHLSAICLPERRRTYNHEGGHDIPRSKEVSDSIADLIRWALAE
ncbi:putative EF-hand calcium-binding domain protein [Penicillium brasilianum]|uniref:Putative EF-hand calcium-binding domain protein n=1 Tax=Penicillium brasilianum TaxID=104259 RepID=A0A1S9S1P2_PENBI|nr:putative EF-hand calcium-binding domain protein [Penicillium brasilianum]